MIRFFRQFMTILFMIAITLTCMHFHVHAQDSAQTRLEILLATGSAQEKQTQQQLIRIMETWDLSRWMFTSKVSIQSGVIPHSHPILTLNTNSLTNDTLKVKSFIHEQLHWFLSRNHLVADSAVMEIAKNYPEIPEVAGDKESAYLHLLVGVLELDALHQLFGETIAIRLIARTPFYTWVYSQVLKNYKMIRSVLSKYHLDSPDART